MTSTELAIRHGVWFGPSRHRVKISILAPLPKNTLDPRYAACIQHRTACDCREASVAEELGELRAEMGEVRQAFEEMLRGHATWVEGADGQWDKRLQCQCTGCEIARRLHLGYANSVVLDRPEPRPPVAPFTLVFAPLRDSADWDDIEVPF
ncbi:hypothetical protein [Sphaerisporangium sp. NPDC051011]|uniref:hypothetical protein n=1 Tax=Sphaerisporangium sp. NPDC051011 TaxID=3155792 RepID=UPI0033E82A91